MSGVPVHAHICAGKMGLLTHAIFYYYGPCLEAVQTFSVRPRWELVSVPWLSLSNPECPFWSRCCECVRFSVLILVQHEVMFAI